MHITHTTLVIILAAAGCNSNVPLGDEPDAGEVEEELPDASDTPSPETVALTVTLQGSGGAAGTVESIPAGLSCVDGVCAGDFEVGTVVTLDPQPADGSAFAGCPGAGSCTFTLDEPIDAVAEFVSFQARTNWMGHYSYHTIFAGCTFSNSGDLSMLVLNSIGGYVTNLELRNQTGCTRVGTTIGNLTSASAISASGSSNLAGTWIISPNDGAIATIELPFTAELMQTEVGTTMIGQWTCQGCDGSFTLVRTGDDAQPL